MQNKIIQQRSEALYNRLKNKLETCVVLERQGIIRIINNMPWRREVAQLDVHLIVGKAVEKIIDQKIAVFNDDDLSFTSLVHDDNVYEPVFNVYPKR